MSTLNAALSLAAKGCLVFPIHPGTKMPAIKGWPEQSTTKESAISKWWTKWPNANVGIHTKGLLVLDIDGPVGEANFRRLRQQHDIPETIRIDSGNLAESHHYQLLFRLPPGVRSWNKPLKKFKDFETLEKIDVKTDLGQVLGPGSIHHTGGVYRWATEPVSVPEETTLAPGWMLALLCRPVATAATGRAEVGSDQELLAVITSRFTITGHGQRSSQAAAVVGYLVGKGIDQERVLRLASDWVRLFDGTYRTGVEIAEQEICTLVYRTFQNLQKGSFELMPDHQQRTAEQLLPAVADWFHKFSHVPISPAQIQQPGQQSTKQVPV